MITPVYNLRIDFEFPPRTGPEDEYLERECEIEDDLAAIANSQSNCLSAGMHDGDCAFLASYSRLYDATQAEMDLEQFLRLNDCKIQKEAK